MTKSTKMKPKPPSDAFQVRKKVKPGMNGFNGSADSTKVRSAKENQKVQSNYPRSSPTPFRPTASPFLSRSSPTEDIIPRSRAEADILSGTNNSTRHRQLPCRTFISTGYCPYKDRCVYLHDPRLVSNVQISTKIRAKNKEDIVVDSLFWPMLKYSSRSVEDEYDVPAPEDDTFQAHDEAVYSTWQHYVDFCITSASSHRLAAMNTNSSGKASSSDLKSPLYKYSHRVGVRDPLHHQKFDDVNRYISKSRLSTFQTMSRGDSLEPGSERKLSLPFEQVAIVPPPTPVMEEEMVSAPLPPSSRGLFPSPLFIEQAVPAESSVVHQSKPITMVQQHQQQHFPYHPLAPPTAPSPGMLFGGPMPQPMMVQQLQHPSDMMLPPPGLVVAMVPPMPMRFAPPPGSQELLAVAPESTYSYNGLMEPQALFPPVPPAHHHQQWCAEAEVEAELFSSHLSDLLEHSILHLDNPDDLACESVELDTKFILEGTESPSSLRSSTNVSPRYLSKQQPHHRHQADADADASDSLLFECSRDNLDTFKEFELNQQHNQQQHTALDDEHVCIGLTYDSLLDHNRDLRLSGDKSFIPLYDLSVDIACSHDNDRDEQIEDGDYLRNPISSACTSAFSTPFRESDACTDSEFATPLSSLRDRSESSCSKDSMFPATCSTIGTASSTGTTISEFSSICPPSKVTFTSPRLVTAARPGNFPGMSFLGAPEVVTTSTTSNAITSDAEVFPHEKDDSSQTAIFSSEGRASSFTEVTPADKKLPEFSVSPRLPGGSCHNVGMKNGDNHIDNESSLKKTYLLRSSAEAAVRNALLSPLPLGSIDNPSVAIFSPRKEQLSGDGSVESSTDSVSLFFPEENESENFIPIVRGPPSLAQHSKVSSPVLEIGYDLVGSRDGSSSYRAFLTPSPTTFESAIELGPPILERESMSVVEGSSVVSMTSDSALSISSPEILWHGGGNTNGKPDPVYAVDMHSDGVMATAGVDESVPPKGTVRLWRVDVNNVIEAEREEHMQNFLCDLSDHPRGAVNVCRFSPNGLMLASASEGQIVVYVVKQAIHWRTMNEENKKTQMERIWLRPSLEEIRDLQWSPDSAHVVACSINNKSEILRVESRDALLLTGHTNYVQGVAWDPLNTLVLTQSADRSMRTYTLKTKGPNAMVKLATRGAASGSNPQVAKMHGGYEVPPEANAGKDKELTAADFEAGGDGDNNNGAGEGAAAGKRKQGEKGKNLFADSTVPSFFRRPTFSPDGELIIAPTGIYRHIPVPDVLLGDSTSREHTAAAIKSKFCTHIFSRHNLSTPLLSLTGLDEPSVAVRCSPVLYTPVVTPEEAASGSAAHSLIPGDYRVVFAVVTVHAVLVYDTQHPYPLAKIGGYHLATINDAAWSADGRLLTVCSSDGYLSFIRFNEGALGAPLAEDKVPLAVKNAAPYLHKYTPPPYVEPEKKTKKTPAAAAAAAAAAVVPPAAPTAAASSSSSTPERIAQAITEQKGSGAATASSSSSSTDSAGKRKRIAPAPVTTATTGAVSPSNLVSASTSSASAEKVLSSIKAAPSATSAANNEAINMGAGTDDAAVAPDAAKAKKRRIAPMLVTNLAGVSAPPAGAVATAVKEGVTTAPEETNTTEAENAAN